MNELAMILGYVVLVVAGVLAMGAIMWFAAELVFRRYRILDDFWQIALEYKRKQREASDLARVQRDYDRAKRLGEDAGQVMGRPE